MSEEPPKEKDSVWGKYYAERGLTRPPMADFSRAPMGKPKKRTETAKSWGTAPPQPNPAVSNDLAAAIAAVEAEAAGVTAAPFITAMHREAAEREERRRHRVKVLKAAGALAVVALLVPVLLSFVFNRAPDDETLDEAARQVGAQLMQVMSSAALPLQIDSTACELVERVDFAHLRYAAVVTLQLRTDLVVPAKTNGTKAYLQLQESLFAAQQQDLKLNLFSGADGPQAPELPRLLQIAHHVGEPVVVRVPLRAGRFGLRWKLAPPEIGLRSANRTFEGDPLSRYAGAPYLIFGSPESMMEIRTLMTKARDYIIAVKKEAQIRAIINGEFNPAAR